MNHALTLAAALAAPVAIATPAIAQEAPGTYGGTLEVAPGTELRLRVIIEQADGALGGALYSLDQGDMAIPLANVTHAGESIAFDVPAVGGRFEGILSDTRMTGEWSQGGQSWPLTLTRGANAAPEPAPLPADWTIPSSGDIETLLADLVAGHAGMAIAVAVVAPGREETTIQYAGDVAYDEDTRFQIGSITKSFTGLLLADMVARSEVSLDDSVQDYLPEGTTLATYEGARAITLGDLATHRSGLPRMPHDFMPANIGDPYADYDEAALLATLATAAPGSAPGGDVAYSNLGVGLLGYALARAAGTSYEALLQERIFAPLGLTTIGIAANPDLVLAQPHDSAMSPMPPWTFDALAPAGGLRADIEDMAAFAKGYLDRPDALAPAYELLFEGGSGVGLGVFRQRFGEREILWHNGATSGSRSMMMVDPARGEAIVVLMNSHVGPSPDEIAAHLLVGQPLPE